jgi:hypothetical protein
MGMPLEALLPTWKRNKVDVEVQAPRERLDYAFRDTVEELWIQEGDCEREARGGCQREGVGH